MTWLKLDDRFPDHPKIAPLSDAAFRLHVAAMCYAAAHETDGVVPLAAIPQLVPKYRKVQHNELVGAGLWEEGQGCIVVHDFTEYNPTRAQIKARREATKERVAKARNRLRVIRNEDHPDAM